VDEVAGRPATCPSSIRVGRPDVARGDWGAAAPVLGEADARSRQRLRRVVELYGSRLYVLERATPTMRLLGEGAGRCEGQTASPAATKTRRRGGVVPRRRPGGSAMRGDN